jgi:hypothetical protein
LWWNGHIEIVNNGRMPTQVSTARMEGKGGNRKTIEQMN